MYDHITLMKKFHCQKTHAKYRNIEWQFTFNEWVNWWGNDINNRGCKKGQLVMARYNDEGPYHPNNVKKISCGDNITEMRKRVRGNGKNKETV